MNQTLRKPIRRWWISHAEGSIKISSVETLVAKELACVSNSRALTLTNRIARPLFSAGRYHLHISAHTKKGLAQFTGLTHSVTHQKLVGDNWQHAI